MRRVVLESPLAGDVHGNRAYLLRAIEDSLARCEAPIAGHATFPLVLDDNDPAQRELGIAAHLAWMKHAEACVVYCDRGKSPGMIAGIEHARALGIPIEERWLDGKPESP